MKMKRIFVVLGIFFAFNICSIVEAQENDEVIREEYNDIASAITENDLYEAYERLENTDGLSVSEKNIMAMELILETHTENSKKRFSRSYYEGIGSSLLNPAEQKLAKAHAFEAIQYAYTAKQAEARTIELFRKNGFQDASDAFRHGYWNAALTIKIGATRAKVWTDAHETTSSGLDKQMDLFNNAIGRSLANGYNSLNAQLVTKVYNAVKSGKMRIIVNNKLVSSKF